MVGQLAVFAASRLVLVLAWDAYLPQSITAYNGAAIIAMTGKNCVAIAADRQVLLLRQVCVWCQQHYYCSL